MQYSQPLSQQQFQNRQLQSPHMQHNIAQNQINQGNQLRNHLSQFSGVVNNALFNPTQSSPNSQMVSSLFIIIIQISKIACLILIVYISACLWLDGVNNLG